MIEVLDSTNIVDLCSEFAAIDDTAFIYFTNKELDDCKDATVVSAVHAYYAEFLPEDLLLIIQAKNDNIVKYRTDDAAITNASSWFPKKDQLGELSDEYYFKCVVIDKQGICWSNY